MIPQSAIDKYLKQEFDAYTWMKREPYEALLELALEKGAVFKTKPFKHQLVSFFIGAFFRENFLFLLDMGAGKTKLLLDLFTFHKNNNGAKKALVVVPNQANVESWKKEVEIHSNLKYVSLYGTKTKRKANLEKKGDVYVINYAGLQSLMCDMVYNRKKKRNQRESVGHLVEDFVNRFDFVGFDETHLLKNPNSLTFELCSYLSLACKYRYGLTGTPMRSPEDLWSQFYVIDQGITFTDRYSTYRDIFFLEHEGYFAKEYIFDKRKKRQLNRIMQNSSIRYEDTEFSDLPKTTWTHVPITLPNANYEHYKDAKSNFINDGSTTLAEVSNSYIKLRQICSGFLTVKNEVTDEDIIIEFPENPKIEVLKELVNEMPYNSKFIVFHHYKHSGALISKALREMKIGHKRLFSGTKDKAQALRDFQDDPNVLCFVISLSAGSTGLNLQCANRTIYFEAPESPITRKQSLKRTHRSGQDKPCFYYDLAVENSVETKILDCLASGEDLFKQIIDGKIKGF